MNVRIRAFLVLALMSAAALVAIGHPAAAAPAARSTSIASAWGLDSNGQLGDGTYLPINVPVRVSGLTDAVAIAAGGRHSLALRPDGTVWAWGDGQQGQLGDGTNTGSNVPVQVSGLTHAVAVAAGGSYFFGGHSLAVRSDGRLWAWGANYYGQLGNGTHHNVSNVPLRVKGLTGAVDAAGGDSHSVALRFDGTVWAWGLNVAGQLGDGTNTRRDVPVRVSGLTNAVAVGAGFDHSLALRSDGTVWTWGCNIVGQLGDGTYMDSNVPVQVNGLTDVVAIAAGDYQNLAVRADGTVRAWGLNSYGQLGDGTKTNRNLPVQVSGLTGAVAVEGGNIHSLAVRADGTAWAWGYNSDGRLGDGRNRDSNVPVQVKGLTGAVAVGAGGGHSLAIADAPTASGISVVSPYDGQVGEMLTIQGVRLGQTISVRFGGGVLAAFRVVSDRELRVRVPDGAVTGPIVVRVPGGKAVSGFAFTVRPSITAFSPLSGPAGTAVSIYGSAFTGATRVDFNGKAADFTVDSYGQITATVPAGATTGPIRVQTPFGGDRTSHNYIVS